MSVRFAILGLLAQRPRHGYELRAAFEAVVGGDKNWEVKPAQIYSTLERMEEAGMVVKQSVEQDSGPEKRIYAITKKGQTELHQWFDSGVTPTHQRDEFFVKLMTGLVSGEADPGQLIQTQRAHLFQKLHLATTLRDSYDPQLEMAQILLLDKAIMHMEADLRWLEITEQRLDEVERQPLPEPEKRPRGRPRKVAAEAVDPP